MSYNKNLFINCPFDQDYYELLKSCLFCVIYLGFNPKISETKDSDDIRIEKIKKLIFESRYSIHDLSRVEPKKLGDLPRFNMAYELGIDIGCKTFCPDKKNKRCLILEEKPHRFQITTSDISGQDIRVHENNPMKIVKEVRDWIFITTNKRKVEKYPIIWDAYNEFHYDYSEEMKKDKLDPNKIWEIPFSELINSMKVWIKNYKK